MKTAINACELNAAETKRALYAYIKKLEDCKPSTQKEHMHVILNFLSFLQQNYERATDQLIVTEARLADWMNHIAKQASVNRAAEILRAVDHFMCGLAAAGVISENPMTCFRLRFGKHGWAGIARALKSDSPNTALEKLRIEPTFTGSFGDHAKAYLDLHRATGRKYRAPELVLIELNRYLRTRGGDSIEMVTPELLREWIISLSSGPRACRSKLQIVGRFFDHLAKLKVVRRNPVTTAMFEALGRTDHSFRPYIFAQSQIRAILRDARQLRPTKALPLRAEMMHTLIGLLYTLGLRIGEALELRFDDIRLDQAAIFIRESKFYKQRHLPLGPRLHRCLGRYLAARNATLSKVGGNELLFVDRRNRPVADRMVRTIFKALLTCVGVTPLPGQRLPRLHDLRHAFAVHRLLRWYKEGVDVQERLVLLSTFMGHGDIYATQVYLTITDSLLNEANQRFQEKFGAVCNREDL